MLIRKRSRLNLFASEPPPTCPNGLKWGLLALKSNIRRTAKAGSDVFHRFFGVLRLPKSSNIRQKQATQGFYALWLGSWASTTTPTARRLAVDTFSHACWHGLCGFLALCRCFLQIFVSFIICFFENNFQYCNGITCFLFWWFYFITKNCSRCQKSKRQNLF